MSKPEPAIDSTKRNEKRSFAINASTRLLMIQAGGLLVLVWLLSSNGKELNLFDSWATAMWFLLGLFAAAVSLGFYRERPSARSRAILVQGFALGFALIIYVAEKPLFVYPIMFLSIVIVLYMQHPDVRERFPFD